MSDLYQFNYLLQSIDKYDFYLNYFIRFCVCIIIIIIDWIYFDVPCRFCDFEIEGFSNSFHSEDDCCYGCCIAFYWLFEKKKRKYHYIYGKRVLYRRMFLSLITEAGAYCELLSEVCLANFVLSI